MTIVRVCFTLTGVLTHAPTRYAGASIAGLASFHAELMKGVGASTRVFQLLEKRSGMSGTETIPDSEFKGHIEFRGVRAHTRAHKCQSL